MVEGAATINTCVNHTECDRGAWPAHVRDCARVVLAGASTFQGGDIVIGEAPVGRRRHLNHERVGERPRLTTTGTHAGPPGGSIERSQLVQQPALGTSARAALVKIENGGTLSVEGSNVVEATLFARGTLDAQVADARRRRRRRRHVPDRGRRLRPSATGYWTRVVKVGRRARYRGWQLLCRADAHRTVAQRVGRRGAFRARRVLMASADVTVSNGTLSF